MIPSPVPDTLKKFILGLALILGLVGLRPAQALAANAAEMFLRLPENECGGYSVPERQKMLDLAFISPTDAGRSPSPNPEQPWVQIFSINLLVLHRPGYGDITYKIFEGRGFQLLAVCRGRQRTAPIDSDCLFNLCLFRLDRTGLTRVELREYLPSISILDFVARDTLNDPRAVRDIADRAPAYGQCLTCNASANEQNGLDIITATNVYAAACNNFLPQFGLLPLTWNGLAFTKPYDRAAPRDDQ